MKENMSSDKIFLSCSIFCLAQLKTVLQGYHGISSLHCHCTLNRAWFGEPTEPNELRFITTNAPLYFWN